MNSGEYDRPADADPGKAPHPAPVPLSAAADGVERLQHQRRNPRQ
ncbi:hypothetical protein [Dactylosporangium sp. CA-152071]